MVSKNFDIHIHDDIHRLGHYRFVQNIQRLMTIPVRPEAVGYIQEVGFEDCLKDFLHTHNVEFSIGLAANLCPSRT